MPDADLVRIEADRRARQHVHAPEVRAGRDGGRLVEEPLDEDHVLAMRHHRQQRPGRSPSSRRCPWPTSGSARRRSRRRRCPAAAAACSPWPRAAACAEQRQRLHPGQRQRDADAAQEMTPGRVPDVSSRCSSDTCSRCESTRRRSWRFGRPTSSSPARLRNWRLVTIFTREIGERRVAAGRRHLVDERPVGRQHRPAQRVAEHLLRQRRHHLLVLRLQVLQQAVGADDGRLVGELAGDVDRLAVGVGRRACRPTASKPSSGKPSGSIRRWQLAQVALRLCCGQPLAAASGR